LAPEHRLRRPQELTSTLDAAGKPRALLLEGAAEFQRRPEGGR
jgi:hypothetical protein